MSLLLARRWTTRPLQEHVRCLAFSIKAGSPRAKPADRGDDFDEVRIDRVRFVHFIVIATRDGVMAMKIRIEKAQCVGNARCHAVAEDLYVLDDDGYIASDGFDVAPGEEASARRGARACPERIIFVIEDVD